MAKAKFKEGDHVHTPDGLSGSVTSSNSDNVTVRVAIEDMGDRGRLIARLEERTYPYSELEGWTEEHEKAHVERDGETYTFMHESAFKGQR